MRSRLISTVVAAAAVVALTAGCAGSTGAPKATSHGTIGIAMPTTSSPRWIADGDNIKRQLTLLGYRTELVYAENDVDRQIGQLQEMVSHGDRALIIAAIDGSKLTAVLQQAADAKIPVISYDRLIRDTPNVSYYATFDNFKVGVVEGNYIVSALGLDRSKGPFRIELFAGSADDNNAGFFFNGAMSVLKPYLESGRLIVPSGQKSFSAVATQGWDSKVANARMTKLLKGPDAGVRVDAVLSPYDGISRGIIDAFRAAGRSVPVITGQDAELDSVKLIAKGQQHSTVYKDTRELAKVAVQQVDTLLNGGTPAVNDRTQYNNGVKDVPTFLLQPIGVDRSNYQRVLVGGGYYTAEQLTQ